MWRCVSCIAAGRGQLIKQDHPACIPFCGFEAAVVLRADVFSDADQPESGGLVEGEASGVLGEGPWLDGSDSSAVPSTEWVSSPGSQDSVVPAVDDELGAGQVAGSV